MTQKIDPREIRRQCDTRRKAQKSDTITEGDALVVKMLLPMGFHHKRIAALFDWNIGRVSEISSGKRYGYVPTINILRRLPR